MLARLTCAEQATVGVKQKCIGFYEAACIFTYIIRYVCSEGGDTYADLAMPACTSTHLSVLLVTTMSRISVLSLLRIFD